jgi:hypothetical protein
MKKLSVCKVAVVAAAMTGLGLFGAGAASAAPASVSVPSGVEAPAFGPFDFFDTDAEQSEATVTAMDDDWEWEEGWDD